jgi:hypothetical protein
MLKRFLRVMAIVAGGYLAAIVVLGREGGRGFFSPDTLEYRGQREIVCFGTQMPLFRGEFEYHEDELVAHLVSKGYWQPREVDSPRWLPLFRWNRTWRDGYSDFQMEFFRNTKHWIEWTNENPEDASQFWPRILELLREGSDEEAALMLHEAKYNGPE